MHMLIGITAAEPELLLSDLTWRERTKEHLEWYFTIKALRKNIMYILLFLKLKTVKNSKIFSYKSTKNKIDNKVRHICIICLTSNGKWLELSSLYCFKNYYATNA